MKNKEEFLNKIIEDLPIAEYRSQMTKDEWKGWFEDAYNEGYKQAKALQLQQTGVMPRFISLVTSFDFNSINEKIDWLGIKREDIISVQHTKTDGFCLYYFKNEA